MFMHSKRHFENLKIYLHIVKYFKLFLLIYYEAKINSINRKL